MSTLRFACRRGKTAPNTRSWCWSAPLDREREPDSPAVADSVGPEELGSLGSLPIRIVVLDANDNCAHLQPVLVPGARLEDAPPALASCKSMQRIWMKAPTAKSFTPSAATNRAGVRELLSLDLVTGVLTVKGRLDFEGRPNSMRFTYRPKTRAPVLREHIVKFW
ncbi:protocadherin gamma-C3-like [Phocoena sinus]|uniref:protocadherin gamma-C3-like n=1 Tax=Phocoena sinus TaxID=42100 RepID=UPI0013C44961|nr:protocadherin gamma-C3-like [Phocoena sinus]